MFENMFTKSIVTVVLRAGYYRVVVHDHATGAIKELPNPFETEDTASAAAADLAREKNFSYLTMDETRDMLADSVKAYIEEQVATRQILRTETVESAITLMAV